MEEPGRLTRAVERDKGTISQKDVSTSGERLLLGGAVIESEQTAVKLHSESEF